MIRFIIKQIQTRIKNKMTSQNWNNVTCRSKAFDKQFNQFTNLFVLQFSFHNIWNVTFSEVKVSLSVWSTCLPLLACSKSFTWVWILLSASVNVFWRDAGINHRTLLLKYVAQNLLAFFKTWRINVIVWGTVKMKRFKLTIFVLQLCQLLSYLLLLERQLTDVTLFFIQFFLKILELISDKNKL